MDPIKGLHHVTAVTRNAQVNVDFYRNVLGQRLVKRTVNFDSPDSYHFYFADETGTPGSVLTFFAWPAMRQGARGNGETAAVAYNISAGSIGFWRDYLTGKGVSLQSLEHRFGVDVLSFDDPDGMRIELVASAETTPAVRVWEMGPIPEAHVLRGFHSVTLWLEEIEPTADLLINQMGYTFAGQEGNRHRFTGGSEFANVLDILHRPMQPEDMPDEAVFGAGSVHHIAFRVPTDEAQLEYQSVLHTAGYAVTPVRDRSYFRSIYYHEPGGVLFEIATEGPGFTIDEPVNELGESLKLPEWFEPTRSAIEQNLPPITLDPIERVK